MTGLERSPNAEWLEADYGDDLVYAAESTIEELKAVRRNLKRATDCDKFRAIQLLRDAQELISEAIMECEL